MFLGKNDSWEYTKQEEARSFLCQAECPQPLGWCTKPLLIKKPSHSESITITCEFARNADNRPVSDLLHKKLQSPGDSYMHSCLRSIGQEHGSQPWLHTGTNQGNIKIIPGLPWWHSGWESACQCRGHGFEPWSGKIPHAVERLSLWATVAEPARLEPVLRNGRGHDSERPAHSDEEWPPLAATRESPHTETKTQHSHK